MMSMLGDGQLTGQFCERTGQDRTGQDGLAFPPESQEPPPLYVSRAACRSGALQRLLSDTDGCGRTAAGTGRSIVPGSRSTEEPRRRRRRRRSVRTSRGGDLRRPARPPPIPADMARSSAAPGTSRNGQTVARRRGGAGSIYPGSDLSQGGAGFRSVQVGQVWQTQRESGTKDWGRQSGIHMTEVAVAEVNLPPVILPDTESMEPSWMRFTNFNPNLKYILLNSTQLWQASVRRSGSPSRAVRVTV